LYCNVNGGQDQLEERQGEEAGEADRSGRLNPYYPIMTHRFLKCSSIKLHRQDNSNGVVSNCIDKIRQNKEGRPATDEL
jgi:hypothetical protein